MFEMLLESGHRSSLSPSWGKGMAVALHVLILGALWRSPASTAPVVVARLALPPYEPTTKTPGDEVPRAPIVTIDFNTKPLPPVEIPDTLGAPLSTPVTHVGYVADTTGAALVPGDGVYIPSLVQDAPELLSAPMPVYPPLLWAAGIQGQVIVTAVVDTLGQAENGSVRIVRSDNPGFDAAALATVRGARFRPARICGRAVRVLVQIPVGFRLN